MLEIYCPTHRSRVLLSTARIRAVRTTANGPVIDWHCWCGTRGSLRGSRSAVCRSGVRAA
jgi:hypothetical protein